MTLTRHTCYVCAKRSRRQRQVATDRWRCTSQKRCMGRRVSVDHHSMYRSWA